MNGITLKQLRYFETLARHQHFGRAAEACAISQPALSMQIKQLEEMFHAPLVERGARHIRLTSLGERLLRKAREILLAVEELDDLARVGRGPLAGRLRLGVIPTVAPYLLPAIISALSSRFPDLDLELREAVTRSLIHDLQEGRLDIAVVALPVSEPTLTEFALFEEDFVLVRPADDAGKPIPTPRTLQTMKLLLLEEGHCFRDQALTFCQISESRPRQLMEGNSLSTLVQMVGAGIGLTLIPEMAVELETRSAKVAIDRFPAPRPSRKIGMIWRTSNPLSDQLMQIGAIIRAVGRPEAGIVKVRDAKPSRPSGLTPLIS
ncbi:hydrogen peroxide-inducible genes activator [Jannaschia seohaensis]|uniref:LysR family hydrogen peroxide-inducible transcriptional activator n=1 Tax=Jannaschia seohaensis TaxID=475081 RepID=A0A2Y9B1D1_9RHOB|nr:hydrogen peroxide-inducible genes activator [Jannaschia seohaensis]PWJ14996.1 LysR family hydrogen peroxide-inducible transcriptional activator [Jannaschia seohaensis]SSA49845.1 LysR family transcriptional regulator, hydrogen peroxide-inducible genes activator [Jannaschia seohaensis]